MRPIQFLFATLLPTTNVAIKPHEIEYIFFIVQENVLIMNPMNDDRNTDDWVRYVRHIQSFIHHVIQI